MMSLGRSISLVYRTRFTAHLIANFVLYEPIGFHTSFVVVLSSYFSSPTALPQVAAIQKIPDDEKIFGDASRTPCRG